ncbi:MAG: substrate-binding domain-containing protein [Betaproteobacteria bacterium]|nr:substrate-binding domain-containing protein [Betaproteobacteria bacterium]
MIVPTIANSIFAETVGGLANALAHHGYQLLLGQTGYRLEEEASLVDAFLGRRVDGLVLTGVAHARGVRGRLRRRVPVVETWDLTARPIDMAVGFGNEEAGRAAARYLIAKGRRSLAFIGGPDDRSAKRLAGFRDTARECGTGEVLVATLPAPASPGEGAAALAGLLGRGRPDAVFCSNDTIAAGVLFECARRRIAVPRDLAVMGFADLPMPRVAAHSTVRGPRWSRAACSRA